MAAPPNEDRTIIEPAGAAAAAAAASGPRAGASLTGPPLPSSGAPGGRGGGDVRSGDRIGRYELEEQLGEGAMALVFAVRHPVLNRRLALKILKREARHDSQYVARFVGDAQAAGALEHPNIVRVVDVDENVDTPFIVMELIDGVSLDHLLAERGRLEIVEAARIGREVASALAAAHEAGIVHRDIKPSNIMIDRRTGAAKLTDFGAAKREQGGSSSGLTFHGQLIGTPRYMAPEQIEGAAIDGRADIFALGASLYEMLAGKPAFEGEGLATVLAGVLHREPTPLREVREEIPPGLASLVGTMLAKQPDGRPATAAAVAQALSHFERAAVAGPPPVPAPAPVGEPSPPPARPEPAPPPPAARVREQPQPPPSGAGRSKGRLPVLALGLAALLAVVAGGVLLLRPNDPARTTPGAEGPGVGQDNNTTVATAVPSGPSAGAPQGPSPPTPEQLKRVLSEVPCVAVVPEVEDGGRVHLEGSAGAPELSAEAERKAAAVPGVRVVDNDLVVAPAPGCHTAARARRAVGEGAAPAPTITLNRADGVYLDKDYLVVDVQLPAGFGGLLYVDVLTDKGETFHLVPEPLRRENTVPPGGRVTIGVEASGRRPGVRHWQSGPPFTSAYVTAVATERRLYEGLRPVGEPLAAYADLLLKALAGPGAGRKTAVAVKRIEFRQR